MHANRNLHRFFLVAAGLALVFAAAPARADDGHWHRHRYWDHGHWVYYGGPVVVAPAPVVVAPAPVVVAPPVVIAPPVIAAPAGIGVFIPFR